MPEWDDIELTERERELESTLETLGPVMQAAGRGRTEEPDPAFLTALRARLVEVEPVAPDSRFNRRLRSRLVGRRITAPWQLGGLAGAAAAAAIALLVILHPAGKNTPRPPVAAGVPLPTNTDLTRGFPPPGAGGGGGGVTPMVSRAQGPTGVGYPARLHLTTGSLPAPPSAVVVYRLASQTLSGSSIAVQAHRLGISGSVVCMSPVTGSQAPCSAQTWMVVAQNLLPSRKPLHSLAVSATGEIVYHDLAYDQFSYKGAALSHARAVDLARAWLTRLGWPASTAPVVGVAPVTQTGPLNAASPIAVSLGWNGGVRGSVPAATLWVAPTGSVVEAHVWPPVTHHRAAASRDVAGAWSEVASGRAPIAVEGFVPYPSPPGSGSATAVSVVEVLVTPKQGPGYLEPAYRFSGRVTLTGQATHTWYTLVPALAR